MVGKSAFGRVPWRFFPRDFVELDGPGRVLISPELRAAAGIERETMLLGMGNHFELWDKASYEAKEAEAMAGQMPDVFKDFSF